MWCEGCGSWVDVDYQSKGDYIKNEGGWVREFGELEMRWPGKRKQI